MQQTGIIGIQDLAWWGGGNVIHRKLCDKLKFDHDIKWYMHQSESIQKNEIFGILKCKQVTWSQQEGQT